MTATGTTTASVAVTIAADATVGARTATISTALGSSIARTFLVNSAKPTITALQRVTRRDSLEPDLSALPLELFVADDVIISRIRGAALYDIVGSASIPTSG